MIFLNGHSGMIKKVTSSVCIFLFKHSYPGSPASVKKIKLSDFIANPACLQASAATGFL